jgi:hypothetical protein
VVLRLQPPGFSQCAAHSDLINTDTPNLLANLLVFTHFLISHLQIPEDVLLYSKEFMTAPHPDAQASIQHYIFSGYNLVISPIYFILPSSSFPSG